jgi:hypothetical protein
VVDILLGALGLVAGSQKPAGRVGSPAGLKAGGLGVVVLSIAILLGNVLEHNSPESLNIDSTPDLGIINIRGAEVTFRANPVGGIIGRGPLGGSSVVAVVEGMLLVLGDVLHQVIGTLVSHIRVLLQEDGIMADLGGDLILGVLRVNKAERKVGVDGTGRRSLGVTVRWGWGRGIGRRRRV